MAYNMQRGKHAIERENEVNLQELVEMKRNALFSSYESKKTSLCNKIKSETKDYEFSLTEIALFEIKRRKHDSTTNYFDKLGRHDKAEEF
jgi:hypothetical protein